MALTYSKIKNMAPGTTLTLKYPDHDGKSVQHSAVLLDTGDWDIYNRSGGHVGTVSAGTITAYRPTPVGLTLPEVRNLPYGSIVYIAGYTVTADLYAIKTYIGWYVYYENDDEYVKAFTDADIAECRAYQRADLGVDHQDTKSVPLPKGTHRRGHTVVAAVRTRSGSDEWRLMTADGTYLAYFTATTDDVRDLTQSDDADDDTNGGVIYVIRTVSGAEYRFSAEEFDNMPEDAVEGTTIDGIFICINRQYIESVAGIPA